jgi:hypothetical protein
VVSVVTVVPVVAEVVEVSVLLWWVKRTARGRRGTVTTGGISNMSTSSQAKEPPDNRNRGAE